MRALITRPREDAEALVAELNAAGIETFVEPLLNITTIAAAVAKLDKVQAILLTSRNGARALAEATEQRDAPIYAVGDATADAARELGFANVESASGDSAALAQLIVTGLIRATARCCMVRARRLPAIWPEPWPPRASPSAARCCMKPGRRQGSAPSCRRC